MDESSQELFGRYQAMQQSGDIQHAISGRPLTSKSGYEEWKAMYGGHVNSIITNERGAYAYNHTDFITLKHVADNILELYGGPVLFAALIHLLVDMGSGEGNAVVFFSWYFQCVCIGALYRTVSSPVSILQAFALVRWSAKPGLSSQVSKSSSLFSKPVGGR